MIVPGHHVRRVTAADIERVQGLGFQIVDLRKRTIYTGDVVELAVLELPITE